VQYVLIASPSDPEANYLMGEILVNRMALAEAMPFLLKALRVSPEELPYVHADLSTVYEDRGDVEQAIAEMKQVVSVDVDGGYYLLLPPRSSMYEIGGSGGSERGFEPGCETPTRSGCSSAIPEISDHGNPPSSFGQVLDEDTLRFPEIVKELIQK
jgi:tetratricopeptide (TPR) repeat protein